MAAKRARRVADLESWKLSQRVFERRLMDRLVQDADMVRPAFFNPNLRGTSWLHRLQLGQNVIPIGNDLDIEPVSWFGLAKGHALFVVGHDRHGGNLPHWRRDFKCVALATDRAPNDYKFCNQL